MLVDVPKVEVKVRHGDQGGLVNELVVGVRCVGGADGNETNGGRGWGEGSTLIQTAGLQLQVRGVACDDRDISCWPILLVHPKVPGCRLK